MSSIPLPSLLKSAFSSKPAATKTEKPPNPMTYPKSSLPYSPALFKNPTAEYRGCPFWAWNAKLEKDVLLRQIDAFAEMGLGGFHMHVRVGLDTEYLGTEFLDLVQACVDYAEIKGLNACLYDEDRWPSGTCGGQVTKDHPETWAMLVRFTPNYREYEALEGEQKPVDGKPGPGVSHLLASWDIELDPLGCLKSFRRLKKGESGTNVWYAFVEAKWSSTEFNGERYVDTMSKPAIARFIELSHEVYKKKVGNKFGTVVPHIFTDEPQFGVIKTELPNAWSRNDVIFPWSYDLAETYKEDCSLDLVENIPEIIWDLPYGKASPVRYHYHNHTTERFVSAFMDQIGDWCAENNIMSGGHMMEEPSLRSQIAAIGDAMRCYRKMQMPGIDLLVDSVEYNTAKQASSVARQNGHLGTLSELYGVTHWTFTFEGHTGCGNWQAALGITFRVHHLAWYSMAGEGKRDYPASIHYQSPWYKEYALIEGHFARVNVAMTRGRAITRIAVVHPIESYWLSFGASENEDEQGARDRNFGELTHWLLHALVDFDFISEALLPDQVKGKTISDKLPVGNCEYDVVILPNLRTIRSTTLKILQEFASKGGKVLYFGSVPELVDVAIPSSNPIIPNSKTVYWNRQVILRTVDEYRDLRIIRRRQEPHLADSAPNRWLWTFPLLIFHSDGQHTDRLLYQMREDGLERFVFICNEDRSTPVDTIIQVKGIWNVNTLNSFNGEELRVKTITSGGWTTFPYRFEGCASVLLRLYTDSGKGVPNAPARVDYYHNSSTSSDITLESVELSEPNVLCLDFAEYRLDVGGWSEPTEVLKIGNQIRAKFHLPGQGGNMSAPYTYPASARHPKTHVTLRFTFNSDIDISESTLLALEDADTTTININENSLNLAKSEKPDWWVDEAIKTVQIPADTIKKGKNTVTLVLPFGVLTSIERIYILGNFAVSLDGRHATLKTLKLKNVTWGDITNQGLPFYSGNVIYNCSFTSSPTLPDDLSKSSPKSTPIALSVPQFSSPVLTVSTLETKSTPAKKIGHIALRPYILPLAELQEEPALSRKGDKDKETTYQIAITAFGNRYNSFGHFHMERGSFWCGPWAWRTEGDGWQDSYNVKPIGILECPKVLVGEVKEEDFGEEWVLVPAGS